MTFQQDLVIASEMNTGAAGLKIGPTESTEGRFVGNNSTLGMFVGNLVCTQESTKGLHDSVKDMTQTTSLIFILVHISMTSTCDIFKGRAENPAVGEVGQMIAAQLKRTDAALV